MISRFFATYPTVPSTRAGRSRTRLALPAGSATRARAGFASSGVKVVVATVIEAILILGFVVSTVGIGAEGHAGPQSGRLPHLVAPAPAPAPDAPSIRH